MLSIGSAAIVRQIVGGNIGPVFAFDGHLTGTGGVAAHPCHRNGGRIEYYRGPEREDLSLDETVGTVAERDVNRARLNRNRADEIVDDLFGRR